MTKVLEQGFRGSGVCDCDHEFTSSCAFKAANRPPGEWGALLTVWNCPGVSVQYWQHAGQGAPQPEAKVPRAGGAERSRAEPLVLQPSNADRRH